MRTSLSLPSLFSQPKLFSSEQQLETARSQFKLRLVPDKNPTQEMRQSRSLIHFQENAEGFSSFRSINSQKMDDILNSLKGMRSAKSNIGQSIKAEILFNKLQYAKIQDYCGKRRQEEKERVVSRLAKLEPLPMKKEVKTTDKNRKKIKTTVGFRISLNYEIYETNRICWKPFIDFDAMPVSIGHRVYFIAGRSKAPLTHYDRQQNKWIEEAPIENIKPFGESQGTVLSSKQVLFFGGSKFFLMGESQVSNSLTYVNLQTKRAQIVQFEREKVEGRCFHGQCIFGDFLLISGGINSKNEFLNTFSAYHLSKHYWFQLTIDKLDPTLKQGFAKHKMMTIMHPRRQYNIYEDEPPLVSKEERQTIMHEGIYFFGGEDSNVELSDKLYILKMGQPSLEVYQPKTQGQPPLPRKNFGWIRIREFLFIQGGRNDEMRPWVIGALSVLSLRTMTWLWVQGDKPTLRHSHTLLQYGEQIVVLGGKNIQGLCKQVYPIKFDQVIEYI